MPKGYVYIAQAGDTFDSLSLDFYDNERSSSTIIQSNLKYRKSLVFAGGEKLFVPIVDASPAATLPPWKRGSA